jgi:hypothetical protein
MRPDALAAQIRGQALGRPLLRLGDGGDHVIKPWTLAAIGNLPLADWGHVDAA